MKGRFLFLFVGTWLIYLAFLPPGIYSVDGYSMLAVADSIVTHGNVTVSAGLGIPGKSGLIYSSWYPLQSVLAVPVVATAIQAAGIFHIPVHYAESISVTVLPSLYTALTVGLVYCLAISLGSVELGAWLAAITYGFGTIALVYARDFYADPLLALLIALGLLLAFESSEVWTTLPVAALAVLAKPTGIILGPVLSVYLFWKTRKFWLSLLPGLGSAIGLATYFVYNYVRFGDFRTFGQPWKFSIGFVPEGTVGLLFSPGAGLIWFCPCVVLSVVALWQMKTRRLEALAIVGLATASLLLHSLWAAWSGGWSWGPRLLLPILPGLVALTGLLSNGWRKVLVVCAVLGFLINAPNLVSFYARYFSEAKEQGISEADLLWSPNRSPLVHGWPAAFRQIQDARQSDVRQMLAQREEEPAKSISSSRALRIVAIWWWVLPAVHVSRMWGILISILLAAAGIWILARERIRRAALLR
jgi:hypothetical protein